MSKQIEKRIKLFPRLKKSIEAELILRTKPDHINDELFLRKRHKQKTNHPIEMEKKGYKQLETLQKSAHKGLQLASTISDGLPEHAM